MTLKRTRDTVDTFTATENDHRRTHDPQAVDNETGADLGAATDEQLKASDGAPQGIIAVDSDGTPVDRPSATDRRVWVD